MGEDEEDGRKRRVGIFNEQSRQEALGGVVVVGVGVGREGVGVAPGVLCCGALCWLAGRSYWCAKLSSTVLVGSLLSRGVSFKQGSVDSSCVQRLQRSSSPACAIWGNSAYRLHVVLVWHGQKAIIRTTFSRLGPKSKNKKNS